MIDSLDPETAVLACCLINRSAIWTAIEEGVRTEHFEQAAHRLIWSTMRQLVEVDKVEALDAIVVAGALTDEQLEDVGGRSYLHALASSVPMITGIRDYCTIMRRRSLATQIRRLAQAMEREVYGEEYPERLAEEYQEKLFKLTLGHDRRGSVPVGSAGESVLAELEFPSRGLLRLPWPLANDITRGLQPGSLMVLAGESSHGKSAAALQISDHVANQGKTVLYVSAEMSTEELWIRLAKIYGFDARCYYGQRDATEVDKERVIRLVGEEKYRRIWVMDDLWDVGQLATEVRRRRPDLLVLDYLQLLVEPGERDSRVEATNRLSRLCKQLAQQYEMPVILLSQLRKQSSESWRTPSLKTLNIDRLRDSGRIGNDADVVAFVYRKVDPETNILLNDAGFLVVKSRNGLTGHVPLMFDGERQRFVEVYKEDAW